MVKEERRCAALHTEYQCVFCNILVATQTFFTAHGQPHSNAPCNTLPLTMANLEDDKTPDDGKAQPKAFTVWDTETFTPERLAQAQAALAATGAVDPTQGDHFSSASGRYWQLFYKRRAFPKPKPSLPDPTHSPAPAPEFPPQPPSATPPELVSACETPFPAIFGNRHYFVREFPVLAAAATHPRTLLELGCGIGNTAFPLLACLPHLTVVGVDVAHEAVRLFRAHPLYSSGRAAAVQHDLSGAGGVWPALARALASDDWVPPGAPPSALVATRSPLLPPCGFDFASLVHVLSAVHPDHHSRVLRDAAECLRPGGRLLLRDWAVYDAAELRFKPGRRLGEHCFVRSDGTLAAYLDVPGVARAAASAGLVVEELVPLHRAYTNRATGQVLRRIFLQAVLRKPAAEEEYELARWAGRWE